MNAVWVLELARDGARNLVRHQLRSTLTLLGVVFGSAAVITMLAVGEGAQRSVLREIQGLGLTNIILDSVEPPGAARAKSKSDRPRVFDYGLRDAEAVRLRDLLPDAAVAQGHLVKEKVHLGSVRLNVRTLGVPPGYFGLFRSRLIEGQLIGALHDEQVRRVAVLSHDAASAAPVVGGPVGRDVRVGNAFFTVIGVVRMPDAGGGPTVFIPQRTARRVFGCSTFRREAGSMEFTRTEVGQIVLHLTDEALVPSAARLVDRVIREAHPTADVRVTVPLDLLRSKQRTQRILNMVLVAIAAISLLVGGIGIMNIMLAVVTERIPEIGIRRALGASRGDILWQFLIEAVVLSTAGGLAGCVLGIAAVPLASRWTGWAGVITPGAVLVSLLVSWLVGVVFGLAPAAMAARLRPVECLRYE